MLSLNHLGTTRKDRFLLKKYIMLKLDVHKGEGPDRSPPKKGQSFGIISNQVLWEFQVQVRKISANF